MKRRSISPGTGERSSTLFRARSIAAGSQRRALLLASVTDAEEAIAALRAGAGVIDLKDPQRGPLGACRPVVLQAARDGCRGLDPKRPLSAAAGPARAADAARIAAAAARLGYTFVKVGLEGLPQPDEALAALRSVVAAAKEARPEVRVIAATYADAASVQALTPARLPGVAARAGCDGCLLDTAVKDGRTLLDHCDARALDRVAADCRRRRLLCALAGSLRADQLDTLAAVRVDLIGARGALCDGGRSGRLVPERLRAFAAALAAAGIRPARRSPAPRRVRGAAPERADRRHRAAPGDAPASPR
jgi:uncharacterized protein (UPF0264 family)